MITFIWHLVKWQIAGSKAWEENFVHCYRYRRKLRRATLGAQGGAMLGAEIGTAFCPASERPSARRRAD